MIQASEEIQVPQATLSKSQLGNLILLADLAISFILISDLILDIATLMDSKSTLPMGAVHLESVLEQV